MKNPIEMESKELVSFLKGKAFFSNFNDSQLSFLLENIEIEEFHSEELLLKEGDVADSMIFLFRGKAQVMKWNGEKTQQFPINVIQEGDVVGEMAFLETSPRSASVMALEKVTILKLNKNLFRSENLFIQTIYNQLILNISKINIQRLRDSNENYVKSIQAELRQSEERNRFGKFFIAIIFIFGFSGVSKALTYSGSINASDPLFNWVQLIAFLLPILYCAHSCQLTWQDAGVTLVNARKSIIEGLLMSGLIIAIAYFSLDNLKQILSKFGVHNSVPHELSPLIFFYFLHSYLQELGARGIAQTLLQRFLNDVKGIKTASFISLIFAVLHLHFGITVFCLTFFVSLLFGLVYIRSYNLIGVSLVHTSIGTVSMLLGLQ